VGLQDCDFSRKETQIRRVKRVTGNNLQREWMIGQCSETKMAMGEIERDHDDLIRYLKRSDDGASFESRKRKAKSVENTSPLKFPRLIFEML
jgi:hypothetical protein